MTVRTRIAPAPSGSLHVGNVLTATFNWLYARKHGGHFVLRIEDTDPSRVVAGGTDSVMEDLRWVGLQWDEGPDVGGPHAPYVQSQRFDRHRAAAQGLLDEGHAYRCWCTPEELKARREAARAAGRPPGYDRRCLHLSGAERAAFESEGRSSVIRFRVPEGETRVNDLVRGEVVFDHAQISDFVILRANETPLYGLAACIDDRDMEITHVIRGEDLFSATPQQIMMRRALGDREMPAFGHVPLIVGADRAPLSKRHGDIALAAYREMGYLPEAMMNYLVLLDWSVGDGHTEHFSVEELVQAFDISHVTRNPSAFDQRKLEAFNGARIRELDPDDLANRIGPFLVREGLWPPHPTDDQREILRAIVPHVRERMARLDEAPAQVRFLFADVEPDARAAALLNRDTAPLLEAARGVLEGVEPWETEAIKGALQGWADGAGIKRKDAFQPLRAAVTGALVSPPLFESIHVLGRERALARLGDAMTRARGAP